MEPNTQTSTRIDTNVQKLVHSSTTGVTVAYFIAKRILVYVILVKCSFETTCRYFFQLQFKKVFLKTLAHEMCPFLIHLLIPNLLDNYIHPKLIYPCEEISSITTLDFRYKLWVVDERNNLYSCWGFSTDYSHQTILNLFYLTFHPRPMLKKTLTQG